MQTQANPDQAKIDAWWDDIKQRDTRGYFPDARTNPDPIPDWVFAVVITAPAWVTFVILGALRYWA